MKTKQTIWCKYIIVPNIMYQISCIIICKLLIRALIHFDTICRMSMIEDDLKRQKNKEAEKLKEKEKRYDNIIVYEWDICVLNWYQNLQ